MGGLYAATCNPLPIKSKRSVRGPIPVNRTRKTKGCLNRKTALAMVFRLMMSARKKWRKISAPARLPELIQEVAFKNGIKQVQIAA